MQDIYILLLVVLTFLLLIVPSEGSKLFGHEDTERDKKYKK